MKRQFLIFRFSSNTGHYTAIAWAKTDKVGCGSTVYQEGRFTHSYLVCNYGEAGNFQGAPMYLPGPACSKCPVGTSCTPEGLCRGPGASQPIQAPSTAPQRPQSIQVPSVAPAPQRPQSIQVPSPAPNPQLPSNVIFDQTPFRPIVSRPPPTVGVQLPIQPLDSNAIDEAAVFFGQPQRPSRPRPTRRPIRGQAVRPSGGMLQSFEHFISLLMNQMRG